jgi:hypothetical protein
LDPSEASTEYLIWRKAWLDGETLQIAHMVQFICDIGRRGAFDMDGVLWLEFEAWAHQVEGSDEPWLHHLFRHGPVARLYRQLTDRPTTEPPKGFGWVPSCELVEYWTRNDALRVDIIGNLLAADYVSLNACLAHASLQGYIDQKSDYGEAFLFGRLVMGPNCKTLADDSTLRDWGVRGMELMKRGGNPLYQMWTALTFACKMRALNEMLGSFSRFARSRAMGCSSTRASREWSLRNTRGWCVCGAVLRTAAPCTSRSKSLWR